MQPDGRLVDVHVLYTDQMRLQTIVVVAILRQKFRVRLQTI